MVSPFAKSSTKVNEQEFPSQNSLSNNHNCVMLGRHYIIFIAKYMAFYLAIRLNVDSQGIHVYVTKNDILIHPLLRCCCHKKWLLNRRHFKLNTMYLLREQKIK